MISALRNDLNKSESEEFQEYLAIPEYEKEYADMKVIWSKLPKEYFLRLKHKKEDW